MKEAYDLGWHTTAKLGDGRLEQLSCTLTIRYTNINSQLQINTDSACGGKSQTLKVVTPLKDVKHGFVRKNMLILKVQLIA